MQTSEKVDLISTALVNVQKQLKAAKKDRENTFFNNAKYADFTAIVEASRDALVANGISVIQGGVYSDGVWKLETRLIHTSGQWIESSQPIVSKDMSDPQKVGSATTYAKRFGYAAMVGVTTEDDDGNEAAAPIKGPSEIRQMPSLVTTPPDANAYLIPFGKFKGKTFDQVLPADLRDYCRWIVEEAKKKNEPPSQKTNDFLMRAKAYLDVGVAQDIVEDIPF